MSHGVLFAYEVAYEVQNKCVKNLSFDFKTSVRKLTTKKIRVLERDVFVQLLIFRQIMSAQIRNWFWFPVFIALKRERLQLTGTVFNSVDFTVSNGYYPSSPAALIKFSIGTGIGHHETIRVKSSNGSEVRVEREWV